MRNTEISIARILFSKNIPFCIYRFPGTQKFKIAIEREFFQSKEGNTLWLTPFYPTNTNGEIFFQVIEESEMSESLIRQFQNLPQQEEIPSELPVETSKEEYFQRIHDYLNELKSDRLNKAVLSRVIIQDKPTDFNPIDFFIKLTSDYPEAFVYLSQHPKSGIWISATPELLVHKASGQMQIMALAGTQVRQHDGAKYEWRQKEMEEHRMVIEHIEQILERHHCNIMKKDGPYTTDAARVVHLRTDFLVSTDDSFNLKSLVKELHPTPAVGGLPVKESMACILKYEGYDRKYYCGYIGETNFENFAHLYINLRCMQVGENKLAIYTGGGITSESNPEEEWEETILKSKTMMDKIKEPVIGLKNGVVG